MRRKEFTVEEEQEIITFLDQCSFGFLGTISPDGQPRVTPLNFVYMDGCFYFHGSLAGEKMKQIKQNTSVSFTVAEEFSLIPSYFTDPELACPATSFFKSVMAFGQAEPVKDLEIKGRVLQRFMEKLQPQGGYVPIDAADSRYTGQLKAVAVVQITPERLTAKFKFGQNLSSEEFEDLSSKLKARNEGRDTETAEMMRKYCPFHQ
ncbi:flavin-nucleotide-binding protein [Paenibacillus sp. Root52]|uniref:Nitroimidazol reductase NimA-like FMN-containing flavoprotein (Pyridoxamine 5'-phosphate oxidase superfamily) n=1 Tax=Paenibacillus amylolyticus TaxID=1451 RepID=A0AAP5LPY0_PAEAM|nr:MULTISPECIES: pyridoxamine 5'-phosphate oxidase family protein [Paenibacillus]KQY80701.1 flavin-nucleotide-binding protein [Paenibacillus sp. Root52]MDR6724938.1 nitroimidazol reductase NimA-like FMN-containing flavoprotein (pyridoxamine 5'-phosphate oxidase superfamily) [Paenibacillus amylolyticus]